MKRWIYLLGLVIFGTVSWPAIGLDKKEKRMHSKIKVYSIEKGEYILTEYIEKTQDEWHKILTPEQYQITRKKGTERAFTGAYHASKETGIYKCVACGNDLFTSKAKFDSGTGWPSFWQPVRPENVKTQDDDSLFSHRIEVECNRCGAHLGHVFEDGPLPTYQRYCINSAALKFQSQ